MPAQASIVINDGQSTPVAHTFVPDGTFPSTDGKNVAVWIDRSPGYKVGFWQIREYHSRPNGNGVEKLRFVLERPVLEVMGSAVVGFNPAPKIAHLPFAAIEYFLPDRASTVELADVAALVQNFAALTFVKDKVKLRERTW